jgi:restriction endonuclease S subunit
MKKVKLGDIAVLKTGPFGTQFSAKEYVESGIPVINVKNIGYGDINDGELDFIDEATRQRLSEHILITGDIVFGRKGSVDRHAYIDERYDGWVQGSDCIRVRCLSKVNSKFVSHYLKLDHIKKTVNNSAVGSTMASLNTDILKDIILELPSIEEQFKIENTISLIEEKIRVNCEINDNLPYQSSMVA